VPPARRYLRVRDLTEALAAPLSAEDQTVQSMPDVSPTKWHRAHTTWFFETFLLGPQLRGYREFHPEFAYLFNSYYETLGARHPRPQRGLLSRPGVAEIGRYRQHADAAMLDLLDADLTDGVAWLVDLGLHHEQQHQELLLMDIKHVLSLNSLRPAYRSSRPRAGLADAVPARWVEHGGGLCGIGHEGGGFAFDNESPRHDVHLAAFALADRPVTCGEWLAFMDDGGYRRPELWLSDGWGSVLASAWEAPLYWSRARDGDGWEIFTLAGARPIDPAEPVSHVSYYEADAFARWCDARLPTEAEWEVVATDQPGRTGPDGAARFLDLDFLHPLPASGPTWFGDVWQWTSSAYLPYPGFRPAPGAVGEYNGKFMVNQHVLRGGCCATPPGHVRATYRNFFPPGARWPFTGVRLARDAGA